LQNIFDCFMLFRDYEKLPPSAVRGGDIHSVLSAISFDIQRRIVFLISDSFGFLIKVPDLGSKGVWGLDDGLAINQINIPTGGHFCDNVELSLDFKAKVGVHVSLFKGIWHIFNVDNIVLLVKSMLLLR